ncbi:three-prime repair exonuclease 1 isoform X2 [Zootermopsis nevadensis]|nr:three-prime repair exonuclease 1 isoform X2 [Zootermopsis nevadensis]
MLNGFMKRVPQPVCIIAHNGLRFDFPILQAELFKIGKAFPDHIMCADSLCGFRNLLQACKSTTPEVDTSEITEGKRGCLNVSCPTQKRLNLLSKEKLQNTLSSFKLDDVYRFLLKRDPVNSHYAENDALNLLECIVALGNGFMEWADENAIQFNSIKEMG